MSRRTSERLSAVLATILALGQTWLMAQASGNRPERDRSSQKPPSAVLAPPVRPNPSNPITFTAVVPQQAEDAHSEHPDIPPSIEPCLRYDWYYSSAPVSMSVSRQSASGPAQEIVSSAPRIAEHTNERVQAMLPIGED